MDLTPGSVIAGRYRADKRVGTGGMGEVWVGEHLSIGIAVAIKTLLPAAAVNHEVVARFKREAYFLGRVHSDHVARVVDFVADDTYGLVLVMEYVEGASLAQLLQRKRMSVEDAIDLAIDIVQALSDLHAAHIVHRDLKPGNIILRPMPDGKSRAVVVDFGVSRLLSEGTKDEETITGITRADMALGTLEYMAPEQVLNSREVTPASDLYAAGALLYRAVAGRHIFGQLSDEQLARKKLLEDAPPLVTGKEDRLGRGFEAVVGRAIKRRPAERYSTAQEMLVDLMPLREAMLLAETELDATTTQDRDPLIDGPAQAPSGPSRVVVDGREPSSPSSGPAPVSAPGAAPTSVTGGSVGASTANIGPSSEQAPSRRGIPIAALVAAVAIALGGGVFLGTTLGARGDAVDASAGPAAGEAPAAAESVAQVEAAPEPPTDTAEPVASAMPIDLGDMDGTAVAAAPPQPAPVATPAAIAAAAPLPRPAPLPAPKPVATVDPDEEVIPIPPTAPPPPMAPTAPAAATTTSKPAPTQAAPKPTTTAPKPPPADTSDAPPPAGKIDF